MQIVIITEAAQEYLASLLDKQDCEDIGIRMFISDPGTPKAETCIAYSRPGEHNEDDLVVEYGAFNAYFDAQQTSQSESFEELQTNKGFEKRGTI